MTSMRLMATEVGSFLTSMGLGVAEGPKTINSVVNPF